MPGSNLLEELENEKNTRKKAELTIEKISHELDQAQQHILDLQKRLADTNEIPQQTELEQRVTVRHEITRLLAEHASLDEISIKILKIMCETINFKAGELWKVDQTNNILRCFATWNQEGLNIEEFINITKQITFIPGIGLPGRIWADKKVHWVEDVVKDRNFPRAKWAEKAGLHGGFGLPILFEGEVLGVICFFSDVPAHFDENLMNLLLDISRQVGIFIEREEAHIAINKLSREAGMAEVASSLLHSIGNVLNTVNTTAFLLRKKINTLETEKLSQVVTLLENNLSELGPFFTEHERGKHLLKYLSLLAQHSNADHEILLDEINNLSNSVATIKEIIDMQTSMNKPQPLMEQTLIPELLDSVLTIYNAKFKEKNISASTKNTVLHPVLTDKYKIEQILIKLVLNAIESLDKSSKKEKQLTLSANQSNDEIAIQIIDNGSGIEPKNLSRIFSFGFTTRSYGHGFGLHSSILAAKEIGGSLEAYSEGLEKGATFTLKFPNKNKL